MLNYHLQFPSIIYWSCHTETIHLKGDSQLTAKNKKKKMHLLNVSFIEDIYKCFIYFPTIKCCILSEVDHFTKLTSCSSYSAMTLPLNFKAEGWGGVGMEHLFSTFYGQISHKELGLFWFLAFGDEGYRTEIELQLPKDIFTAIPFLKSFTNLPSYIKNYAIRQTFFKKHIVRVVVPKKPWQLILIEKQICDQKYFKYFLEILPTSRIAN